MIMTKQYEMISTSIVMNASRKSKSIIVFPYWGEFGVAQITVRVAKLISISSSLTGDIPTKICNTIKSKLS